MKKLTLKDLAEIEQRAKSKPSEDNVRVVWQEYCQLADQDIPRLILEIRFMRSLISHLVHHAEGDLEKIIRMYTKQQTQKGKT